MEEHAFGGALSPYSWKGSWALWKRGSGRSPEFTAGHEGSGSMNSRSSLGKAAWGLASLHCFEVEIPFKFSSLIRPGPSCLP